MRIIDRLVEEAHTFQRPAVLKIQVEEVEPLAREMNLMLYRPTATLAALQAWILAGDAKIAGIPVQVSA